MRGSIEKRGDKHYRIRVDLGRDEQGKRTTKSQIVRGTRKEAEARLRALVASVSQPAPKATEDTTVSDLIEQFLTRKAASVAARTAQNYREYLLTYVQPALGALKLSNVTAHHIQDFYEQLLTTGRVKTGGGLSRTTVHNLHRVLRGMMQFAVHWHLIAASPLDLVAPPRPEHKEQEILSKDEVAKILAAAHGTRLYIPILVAVSTGMRRAECCGLRWIDIDLDRGVLAIVQTLVNVAPGRLEFKTTKTRSGRRSVKLPAAVVMALRAEKERQDHLRHELGTSYNAAGLVVIREDGSPFHPATLYSSWRQLLARLDLPKRSWHSFRHTHVSVMLEAGVNVKSLAERIGHHDPSLTLRVYAHLVQDIQQDAADKTEAYLRSTLPEHEPPL